VFEFEPVSGVNLRRRRRYSAARDHRDCDAEITKYELRIQANEKIAEPLELAITASIRRAAACMRAAIHFVQLPSRRATKEKRPQLRAVLAWAASDGYDAHELLSFEKYVVRLAACLSSRSRRAGSPSMYA
jgi:hypothetical protein